MTLIRMTKEFTADQRPGDVVSIAVILTAEPDEFWRRSFREWMDDEDWVADQGGAILGFSFPATLDGTGEIEFRTYNDTIEKALTAISATIDKVNETRTEATTHNPKRAGEAERRIQAWFDEH